MRPQSQGPGTLVTSCTTPRQREHTVRCDAHLGQLARDDAAARGAQGLRCVRQDGRQRMRRHVQQQRGLHACTAGATLCPSTVI